MPRHITDPTRIAAAGDPPKQIDELVGRINSQTNAVSIARMVSPPGWKGPAQTPAFDEYTIVLRGLLRVEHGGAIVVRAGEAVVAHAGEQVRSSTPGEGVNSGLPAGVRARDCEPPREGFASTGRGRGVEVRPRARPGRGGTGGG